MLVTNNGGKDFEQTEAGIYAAVCTRVVDLGTQEDSYEGKKTNSRKVLLGFELEHFMSDGRPFYIMATLTASIGEKATLRKLLEGWRGKAFTADEEKGFELGNVLGKPAMLVVGHTKNGKAKINAASRFTSKDPAPAPTSGLIYLDLDKFDQAAFDGLSEWAKGKIMQSPEWAKIGHVASTDGVAVDDIPF